MMDNGKKDTATQVREAKQLRRLEVVMDVVYAILIWRAFQLLPRPTKADWSLEGMKALDAGTWSGARAFAMSCERPSGGFSAGPWDPDIDVEYTYYGLGIIALAGGKSGS